MISPLVSPRAFHETSDRRYPLCKNWRTPPPLKMGSYHPPETLLQGEPPDVLENGVPVIGEEKV